jgi:hypothetical protein
MSIDIEKDERYLLSYTFYGDNLPLNELADILNVDPESIEVKGMHRKNNPSFIINDTNYWSSPILKGYKPEDFYTAIENILANFSKKEDYLLDLVNNKGVKIDFSVTFTGGPCVTELLLPSFWKEFDIYKITFRLSS